MRDEIVYRLLTNVSCTVSFVTGFKVMAQLIVWFGGEGLTFYTW